MRQRRQQRRRRERDTPRSTPSALPLLIALGLGLTGAALVYWSENRDNPLAIGALILACLLFVGGLGGWIFQDIRDSGRRGVSD